MQTALTTNAVDEIGRMNLAGNLTPASWYQHIKFANGKTDLAAVTILADVVYWYRPVEIRDEETGATIGWRKKFAGDMLQRGYAQLAEQFGLSKEQARDACHRLRDAGLLRIEIRNNVRYGDGMIANNVVYLEPMPEAVAAITYNFKRGAPPQAVTPNAIAQSNLDSVAMQPTPPADVETNTEITTEIFNNNNNAPAAPLVTPMPPSAPAPQATPNAAWLSELEAVVMVFDAQSMFDLADAWQKFPDARRHNEAMRQLHNARMRTARVYLKAFLNFNPDWKPSRANAPALTNAERLAQWKAARAAAGMDTRGVT
jgi:hypothetical protein